VVGVGANFEGHEVAEVAPAGRLQLGKNVVGRTHQPQVDVLRGTRSLEAKLEHEAALERGGVTKHSHDPRKKAIEHE